MADTIISGQGKALLVMLEIDNFKRIYLLWLLCAGALPL